jgi:hypothetical protein
MVSRQREDDSVPQWYIKPSSHACKVYRELFEAPEAPLRFGQAVLSRPRLVPCSFIDWRDRHHHRCGLWHLKTESYVEQV